MIANIQYQRPIKIINDEGVKGDDERNEKNQIKFPMNDRKEKTDERRPFSL
jgi:hypothetical protein